MTLPVGLAALQGFFASDFRGDRGRRDDDGHADPAVLRRRAALLRPRAVGGRQGVSAAGPAARSSARVMLAFEGEVLPDAMARAAGRGAGGGMTLFRHYNVRSPGQVRELTEAFQRRRVPVRRGRRAGLAGPRRGRPGGRAVHRPRRRVDAVRRQHGARRGRRRGLDRARRAGDRARGAGDGRQRRLRPGARPRHRTRRNPALGIRAFGDDPALVARHGAAMVRGLQSAGVAATVKHAPGAGDAAADHAPRARRRSTPRARSSTRASSCRSARRSRPARASGDVGARRRCRP